jgi:hypothetical protein
MTFQNHWLISTQITQISLQTYIWMKSDTAQPPEKSALDFGWEDQNGLSPVYFVVHFIITIFICSLSQRVATCISPLTLTQLSAGQILFSTNTTLRTPSDLHLDEVRHSATT